MSSVEFKFLAMPNVEIEMRVLSVDLEYEGFIIFYESVECRVSSVRLIPECRMSTNF